MSEKQHVTTAPEIGALPIPDRETVTFRLRKGLRARLRNAAAAEGRTMNEAANSLLEKGLRADQHLAETFGSTAVFALARALMTTAEAAVTPYGGGGGRWIFDSKQFDRAAAAINQLLRTLRPESHLREAIVQLEEGWAQVQMAAETLGMPQEKFRPPKTNHRTTERPRRAAQGGRRG
jgi:hypothetical protein